MSSGKEELGALRELVEQIGGKLGRADKKKKLVEVTLPGDPTKYRVNYVELIRFQMKMDRDFARQGKDYLTGTQVIIDISLFHMRELGLVDIDLETGMVRPIRNR